MVPAWTLFLFIPGVLQAVMPWAIGLSALCLVGIAIQALFVGGEYLLTRAAKALPACWLFDGPAQPVKAVPPKPVVLCTAKDVDWDWRYDDTDYPSGRH